MKTKREIIENQIRIQEKMQKAGYNVVTCGNCGSILLHETEDETIECLCGRKMNLADCPDYWYEGCQNSPEFEENEDTQFLKLGIYWSTQDFETLAIQNFEELKKDHPEDFKRFDSWEQLYDKTKFPEALKKMIDQHDCEVGITWLTLEHYLGECEIKK